MSIGYVCMYYVSTCTRSTCEPSCRGETTMSTKTYEMMKRLWERWVRLMGSIEAEPVPSAIAIGAVVMGILILTVGW